VLKKFICCDLAPLSFLKGWTHNGFWKFFQFNILTTCCSFAPVLHDVTLHPWSPNRKIYISSLQTKERLFLSFKLIPSHTRLFSSVYGLFPSSLTLQVPAKRIIENSDGVNDCISSYGNAEPVSYLLSRGAYWFLFPRAVKDQFSSPIIIALTFYTLNGCSRTKRVNWVYFLETWLK